MPETSKPRRSFITGPLASGTRHSADITPIKEAEMRIIYVALFAAAVAIPAHAAMPREEALKHWGTASAAEPYCRNINSGDTIRVLDALGIDIGVDYENATMIKARSEQTKKFNAASETSPKAVDAECKKIYEKYGPNGTAIKGFFTDPG
ncbi:hypothetical protein [Lysobacter capsici]|uniref:hypothetical protein n=1 Tax=Lysobacter capsici TaxID=435897 RepID=UPI000BBA5347|nr:hypothetical protein [Lysobacter capsici]ATE74222.1 hypothetical protein CNO08_24400 [Lysobacter capsici]